MSSYKVLVVYPRETTTQIAIFRNQKMVFLKRLKHNNEEYLSLINIVEKANYRTKVILRELQENGIKLELIQSVVGRGGLIRPVESGVYQINELMKDDLIKEINGYHSSNMGALIADELAKKIKVHAYIADPGVVDEMDPVAKISGHPLFERKSVFHALGHKTIARKYAKSLHKKYEDLRLIVVQVGGGGISVGAHKDGKVVDVNQALDGEGPFSLERAGTLPAGDLVRLCYSGKYSEEEIIKMLFEKGGLLAYLGTRNLYEIQARIDNGDEKASFHVYAMAYQITKEIGSMFTVLEGNVNAIILCGGIFYSKFFSELITSRIEKIGKIVLFPDEDEMEALNLNAQMVLSGELEAKEYK